MPSLFHRALLVPTRLAGVVGGGSPRARFGSPHPPAEARSGLIERRVELLNGALRPLHSLVRVPVSGDRIR
jgi:hypothetical protein